MIVDRALTLLPQDLERRMCGGDVAARCGERDGGRLQAHFHVDEARGLAARRGALRLCRARGALQERSFLEYHHVQPYAAGGVATTANIELRYRAHNVYEASLFFRRECDRVVEHPTT